MDYLIRFKNFLREFKKDMQNRLTASFTMFVVSKKQFDDLTNKKFKNDRDKDVLKLLEKDLKSYKEKCNMLSDIIIMVQTVINSFDNNKAIRFIDDPWYLLCLVTVTESAKVINSEEASRIMGSSFVFNINHTKKENENEISVIIRALAAFYNLDGSFKLNTSDTLLKDAYEALIDSDIDLKREIDELNVSTKKIIDDIQNLYNEFVQKQIVVVENVEEDIVKVPASSRRELRKYYKKGRLVTVPEDLEEFDKLLDICLIDEEERKRIYTLIRFANKEALEEKCVKQGELRVDTRSYDREDNSNEESANNLIFLKDTNNQSYFSLDIETIDKGLHKQLFGMLSKIDRKNKRKFRRVFEDSSDLKLYELVNNSLHIIFYELRPNIYLVIGASTRSNSYYGITKRIIDPKNREFIEAVSEALDNKEERKKLLDSNALELVMGQKLERVK